MVAILFVLEHPTALFGLAVAFNLIGWTCYIMRKRHKAQRLSVVPQNITPITFEPSEATFTTRRKVRNGRMVPHGYDAS